MPFNDVIRPPRTIHVARAERMRRLLIAAAIGATLVHNIAAAAPSDCKLRLSVELTPDVPNPRDEGFLSSLLSNHPGYQLTLRQQRDGSVIVVELTGPGPAYRCENVVETIRKDGRVLSVHVE
jgi:hypothetical protein